MYHSENMPAMGAAAALVEGAPLVELPLDCWGPRCWGPRHYTPVSGLPREVATAQMALASNPNVGSE